MRTWLLHIGEQLPVDTGARRFRYGYLAETLANQGHQVLRWAPTFRHIEKTHRYNDDRRVKIDRNYSIQFVHSIGYGSNVGVGRLLTYQLLGNRLRRLMSRTEPPDLIVAAIPSLEWAAAAVEFGRAHHVPVVIDVRDLWPDVYLNALPKVARKLGRYPLQHYFRLAEHICREADALVGVSQGYLDWALELAGREQRASDAVVPIGYEPESVSPAAVKARTNELIGRGVDPKRPTCFFAGSFERSYDLETVLESAGRLRDIGRKDLQFLLAGDGRQRSRLLRMAKRLQLNNVHFLGWADQATLRASAAISQIGLCAYADDATQGLPNKPFEYMADRLAIVSSLQGEMAKFLRRHECGVTYNAGSVNALTNAINRIVLNPVMLDSMRTSGHEAWARLYRSRDVYARFANLLTSLVVVRRQAA